MGYLNFLTLSKNRFPKIIFVSMSLLINHFLKKKMFRPEKSGSELSECGKSIGKADCVGNRRYKRFVKGEDLKSKKRRSVSLDQFRLEN